MYQLVGDGDVEWLFMPYRVIWHFISFGFEIEIIRGILAIDFYESPKTCQVRNM